MLVRSLAALAILTVAAGFVWWWSLSVSSDPNYQPEGRFQIASGILEGMILTIALILSPAVMAGSLAGEKERGSLGLLLTTRVNAFEIVVGRLLGKFSQVAMMVLATLPGTDRNRHACWACTPLPW